MVVSLDSKVLSPSLKFRLITKPSRWLRGNDFKVGEVKSFAALIDRLARTTVNNAMNCWKDSRRSFNGLAWRLVKSFLVPISRSFFMLLEANSRLSRNVYGMCEHLDRERHSLRAFVWLTIGLAIKLAASLWLERLNGLRAVRSLWDGRRIRRDFLKLQKIMQLPSGSKRNYKATYPTRYICISLTNQILASLTTDFQVCLPPFNCGYNNSNQHIVPVPLPY